MENIKLTPPAALASTVVQNAFIDRWLPHANGEFIKVYLYMLRLAGSGSFSLDTGRMADKLLMLEADILRALKYWDREKVLQLRWTGKAITGIAFLQLEPLESPENQAPEDRPAEALAPPADVPSESEEASGQDQVVHHSPEAYRQLVYYAEALFGRTLSQKDTEIVLGLVDTFHLTFDVAEYLIELVALKNKNLQYMEKVAADWADNGVDTVEMAKVYADLHNSNYYRVFKALGIYNHKPQADEKKLIDKWIKEYNFAIEVVEKACGITITSIHEPSLKYTDSILSSWYSNGTMSIAAIEAAEAEFK